MNGKYEAAAIAVKNAEQALETLKGFSETQYKAIGTTMREQIANYIANVLADAHYVCRGFVCGELALSKTNEGFAFGIRSNSMISGCYQIFSVCTNGDIRYARELKEHEMLHIVEDWDEFKKMLDFSIKTTLKYKTEAINKKIAHIAHVNEQLSKWKV